MHICFRGSYYVSPLLQVLHLPGNPRHVSLHLCFIVYKLLYPYAQLVMRADACPGEQTEPNQSPNNSYLSGTTYVTEK